MLACVIYRTTFVVSALILTGMLSFLSYILFQGVAREAVGVSSTFLGYIGGMLVIAGLLGKDVRSNNHDPMSERLDWFCVAVVVIFGFNLTDNRMETAVFAYLALFGLGMLRQLFIKTGPKLVTNHR